MLKKDTLIPIITTILGLIGLGVSAYLSHKVASGTEIGTCPIFGTGCGDVLHSKYSEFLGIPLAYYGMVFYSGIIAVSLLLLATGKAIFKHLLALGAIIGFLDSVMFIYIQGVLIGAYCFYCVISAVTATLLFITMLGPIIDRVLDLTEKPEEEGSNDDD